MDEPQRCWVVVQYAKPKTFAGKYYPEDRCGTYGRRNKNSFAIPYGVEPVLPDQNDHSRRERALKPYFTVNPINGLAQPIGVSELYIVETWAEKKFLDNAWQRVADLQTALEVAMNKRYVKQMTLKARDLIEMLIIGSAGAGVALFILHMIGTLTGNAVTI